jgi:hypothetical protein
MESKGMSLNVVLTIVFVVLRLCEVITWSWVWVFSPLWISWSIVIILLVTLAIFFPEAFRNWWRKL